MAWIDLIVPKSCDYCTLDYNIDPSFMNLRPDQGVHEVR